jgi:hypothetical protein
MPLEQMIKNLNWISPNLDVKRGQINYFRFQYLKNEKLNNMMEMEIKFYFIKITNPNEVCSFHHCNGLDYIFENQKYVMI